MSLLETFKKVNITLEKGVIPTRQKNNRHQAPGNAPVTTKTSQSYMTHYLASTGQD